MADQRIEKLAKLCVNYSVDVKPKEKVVIQGSGLAFPLINEIYKECLLNDAYPLIIPTLDVQYIFFKYAKEHVKLGKIKMLRTPVIVLKNKKTDIVEEFFFELNDYNDYISKHPNHKFKADYKKGLGSWEKSELEQIIDKKGVEHFIETFKYSSEAEAYIHNWLSNKTANARKDYLKANEFSLFKV